MQLDDNCVAAGPEAASAASGTEGVSVFGFCRSPPMCPWLFARLTDVWWRRVVVRDRERAFVERLERDLEALAPDLAMVHNDR